MALAVMVGTATGCRGHRLRLSRSMRRPGPPVIPGHPMIRPGGLAPCPARAATAAAKVIGSTNWSGYAVYGSHGAYRSVSASWIEPAVTCSAPGGPEYASFWVGLDGYRQPARWSRPEPTPTAPAGPPEYSGWYEMYPAKPVYFRTQVRPGDHIAASVTFRGTDTYTLVLKDTHPRLDPHDHQAPDRPGPVLGRGDHRGAVVGGRRAAARRLRHRPLHRSAGSTGDR